MVDDLQRVEPDLAARLHHYIEALLGSDLDRAADAVDRVWAELVECRFPDVPAAPPDHAEEGGR